MKILYLYSEIMPYQMPVFRMYVQKYNASVEVVHWDHVKNTPYAPPEIDGVRFYGRSHYNRSKLIELAEHISPDIIYVSGWMDKDYLAVAGVFKNRGIPVVVGFDTCWLGTMRQYAGALMFPFFLKKYFTHAWVAGPNQHEFGKRLGFKEREIVFNLLSGDTALFGSAQEYLKAKEADYPRAFLYVGRFTKAKGVDLLVESFNRYRSKPGAIWKLICVGNGELKPLLDKNPNIELIDFIGQEELLKVIRRAGVFVLPSRYEPYGLVVHEFCAAGMPLILSDSVGARSTFLVPNYNGLSFGSNSAEKLARAMSVISSMPTNELVEMGRHSAKLSARITPEITAASFISVLNS